MEKWECAMCEYTYDSAKGDPARGIVSGAPFDDLPNTYIKVKDKLGAAFGSFGWSGEGPLMLTERLKGLKFRVPEEPLRVQLVPGQADLKSCEEYGRRLAAAL